MEKSKVVLLAAMKAAMTAVCSVESTAAGWAYCSAALKDPPLAVRWAVMMVRHEADCLAYHSAVKTAFESVWCLVAQKVLPRVAQKDYCWAACLAHNSAGCLVVCLAYNSAGCLAAQLTVLLKGA